MQHDQKAQDTIKEMKRRAQSFRDQAFARRCSDNTAQGERDYWTLMGKAFEIENKVKGMET